MNLHTSIAVKMDDFDEIDVEDKHHIIINVKDFRAILQHAGTTCGKLTTHYSQPWSPLRFSYGEDGLLCQFVLMTVGEKAETGSKKSKSRLRSSNAARPVLSSGAPTLSEALSEPQQPSPAGREADSTWQKNAALAGSSEPASAPDARAGFEMRPRAILPSTIRMETLLDDDSQWEPVNPEEDPNGFVQIEWDESLQPVRTKTPSLQSNMLYNADVEFCRSLLLCPSAMVARTRAKSLERLWKMCLEGWNQHSVSHR